ncbi:MAG: hypothetical protein AAF824_12420 [Bacteroidota bacterium]
MKTVPIPSSHWKGYQKMAFRFAFIFFSLFIVLLDWSVNPVFSYLYYYGYLSNILDVVISWIGNDLFQLPYVIISPYDGEHNDRTYVYLLYLTLAVVGVVGAFVWSFLDRNRQNYEVLYYWLTTIIRYYLAFTMFLFALEKFFKMQFPDLGYYTLTEPVGDMSPMHLAWAFFSYSYGYNIFIGIAESAGLLLLFRRTTTIGAILTMGTLANVMAVNYHYDVHAKMYPTALFFMTFFLLLRDAGKIIRFFFTSQSVSLPVIKAPVSQKKWINIFKIGLKFLVIGFVLLYQLTGYMTYRKQTQERLAAISDYAGLYDVRSFVVNKDTLPLEDPLRWNQLVVGDRMLEAVRFRGDSIAFASVDIEKKEMIISGELTDLHTNRQKVYNELGSSDETYEKMDSILVARQLVSSFHFELVDSTTLFLRGRSKNDSIYITARRRLMYINDFRLMKRRFHWINESYYFY